MKPQTIHDLFANRDRSKVSRSEPLKAVASPLCDGTSSVSLVLARENVIGVLLAAANLDSIPAATWPVEAALELLGVGLPAQGALVAAIGRWQMPGDAVRSRFPGLPETIRSLVGAGHLLPAGTGPQAALGISPAWRKRHAKIVTELSLEEQTLVSSVAQRLVALSTTASKRLSTEGPCGSGAMRSSHTRRQELIR
jgi:hypothetical protein